VYFRVFGEIMSLEDLRVPQVKPVFPAGASMGLQPSSEFLESLPLAIYACGADGRLLWFNKRACELWGRTPLVGDPSERYCGSHKLFFAERQITREQTPMAEVLRTGVPVRGAEARLERPDGTSAWAMVHIEPVRDEDGQIVGAINCFHEMPGPPLERERRLAATYESAGIGIIEIDAAGRLLRVNAHLRALLDYPEEELLGRSIFDLTHADDVTPDKEKYRQQVAGEIDGYTLEKRFRRRDGSYLWTSITSRSVRDPEGNFLYAVRVQHDITKRKQSEEILTRYAEQQGALHDLVAKLQHAVVAEDVYTAAMDAMFAALRCDRASVLLFDQSNVMRFVASHGLSKEYCKAVDGHSPWSVDTPNPQPVCIEDVAKSDLAADLKQVVTDEGIAALAFIPLQESGRLIGKFMIYYNAPHAFGEREIILASTIAHHVGFSVGRLHEQRAALQLAAIVESSEDAIVSKDLNGTIRSWNRGAERLFGFTAEEAIGKPITLVIPADRLDEEPRILQRIRNGERVEHFETVRRRKDGSLIDISLTISPIKDKLGNVIGASKIARDITERKAADAKLRENERRLHDLLSAIPAAIYTTDAQGRVTYFNEAAVELAGRTPTLGSDEWCVTWKLYWPDGRPLPHDQCPMAMALKEGRPIRGYEAVAERPDGTRVPFIPYPTPIRDAKGNVVGAINMLVDISRRKEAETQQRILLNELSHRVKNNMQMLQSLLSSAVRNARSAEAKRSLEDATARVSAMAAAQRALYGHSRAGHFDALEFVKSVCETIKQTFSPDIEVTYDADAMELSNDTAMPLALVLNELVTNAAKYGLNGKQAGTIRVALIRKENTMLSLAVEDDGPGFDLGEVRGRSSGLSIVEGLARQLGGALIVTRTPKACCRIEFPQSVLA
jgi:PAS domain S-box-containing protein